MTLWDKDRQKKGTVKINIEVRDHETTSEEDSFSESETEEEVEQKPSNAANAA